jgi:HEAT repeat protein
VATTIENLYRNQDWRVRREAVDELLWYPSERVEEALLRALRDPVLSVREAAVLGLARVGTNRCLTPLMQAMRDTPGPVRDTIALTLRKLTGEDYGRHLDRWRRWHEANRDALR